MKEKAIESGAHKLGAEVRRLFNEPFKSAVRAQRRDAVQG